jgi:hypothetical protein
MTTRSEHSRSDLRLSEPQARMLARLRSLPDGERVPGGSRDAGRAAAAWYRTAKSLVDRGLAAWTAEGDSYRLRARKAGRA